MRVVGVSARSSGLWLALADDGVLVDAEPYVVRFAEGMASGGQLVEFLSESQRILRVLKPDEVIILEPETSSRGSAAASAAARVRHAAETLIELACAQAKTPASRMTRAKCRSVLDLPRSGALSTHAGLVIESPLKPHWKDKRDCAALAALAGCANAAG